MFSASFSILVLFLDLPITCFSSNLMALLEKSVGFAINTTVGGLGFFDVAKNQLGIEASQEDFGQTLGHYGVGNGAYLVLPFVGPSTVRDTFGYVIDGAMDPKQYVLSGTENFAISTGTTAGSAVNERALNLELFEQVDRFSLDLYSAAQDFYLQRREQQIEE